MRSVSIDSPKPEPSRERGTHRSEQTAGRGSWLWNQFERGLAGLSSWGSLALFACFLAWFGLWTVIAALTAEWLFVDADQGELSAASAEMLPALGVLFSFLTGFVISSQWNRSRSAEGVAGSEADAAVRLALASQTRGIDGVRIRRRLATYLRTVVDDEWETLVHHSGRAHLGAPVAAGALDVLELDVRSEATAEEVRTAVSDDLLRAAENLAVARRNRLNLSGHGLPAPLFILVFVAGVVLTLDAVFLASGRDGLAMVVVAGLVVLIALDLALIVAISDPFRGPMRALPTQVITLLDELEAGRFGPLTSDVETS